MVLFALSVVPDEVGSEGGMHRRISQTNSHLGHLSAKHFLSAMGNKKAEVVCSPLLRIGLRMPEHLKYLLDYCSVQSPFC